MSMRLQDQLAEVEVLAPETAGNLQVFGLRWSVPADLDYRTLDEAIASQTLTVTEISEGGSVPTLKVSNRGESMVFLMAGEILLGAKQNRTLNVSVMVGGRSEIPIPVSCVERGRWGYQSRAFHGSGSSSHSRLRAAMAKDVLVNYRRIGRPESQQGKVWQEVERKLASMGSSSPSESLYQAYEDRAEETRRLIDRLRVPADCSGVAFAFGGRIAGVDIFDKPSTLAKLFPKLVEAYAIDAMESPGESAPVTRESVEAWLRGVKGAIGEPFDSPGVGRDLRLESPEHVGAGLLISDKPVHVELYPQN